MGPRCLKHRVGAHDIRLDKCLRTINRPVNVRLCCQVNNDIGACIVEHRVYCLRITNISPREAVPWIMRYRFKRRQRARISEFVKNVDRIIRIRNQVPDQSGTNEARTTSDENRLPIRKRSTHRLTRFKDNGIPSYVNDLANPESSGNC